MNERAANAFLLHTEHARAFAYAILKHIGDHFEADPENINWSHVGTVIETVNRLEQIADFLGVKLEGE